MSKEELEKLIKENNANVTADEIFAMTKQVQEKSKQITEEDVLYAYMLANLEDKDKKPSLEDVVQAHEALEAIEPLTMENMDYSHLEHLR